MASIAHKPLFKRGVGKGELFPAKTEAFRLPAKAIAAFKIPFTVIQSLRSDGFSKTCVLKWKQQVVGVTGINHIDQGVSPLLSAESRILFDSYPVVGAHFPIIFTSEAVNAPMASGLLRSHTLLRNCTNRELKTAPDGTWPAPGLTEDRGFPADLRLGIEHSFMIAIKLGRIVANMWRAVLSWTAAKRSISAGCLLDQQSLTGKPVPIEITV